MRFFWPSFLTLLLVGSAASITLAATTPNGLSKSICFPGTTTEKSSAIYSVDQAKQALFTMLQSNNFCTNEQITVTGLFGNVLQDQLTCVCTNQAQYDAVGCGVGQTQPTVTTNISHTTSGCTQDTITVSKCVTDPETAYTQACNQGKDLSYIPPTVTPTPPPPPAPVTPTPPPPVTPPPVSAPPAPKPEPTPAPVAPNVVPIPVHIATPATPPAQTGLTDTARAALEAQLEALMSQISALQEQSSATSSQMQPEVQPEIAVATGGSACPTFTRYLSPGSTGSDVLQLQQFLSKDPSIYPEGEITGYYGSLTEAAVQRFQVAYGIVSSGSPSTTGYGGVGPITIAVLTYTCNKASH